MPNEIGVYAIKLYFRWLWLEGGWDRVGVATIMSEGQDERKRGLSRRSLSPPEPSKVSLIQNRLLSKANRSVSDLSQVNEINFLRKLICIRSRSMS